MVSLIGRAAGLGQLAKSHCHVRHKSRQKEEGPRRGGRSVRCKAADVDDSGNPYVEQFIHGSAQGPIQMEVLRP
jgi:hypothetical protein